MSGCESREGSGEKKTEKKTEKLRESNKKKQKQVTHITEFNRKNVKKLQKYYLWIVAELNEREHGAEGKSGRGFPTQEQANNDSYQSAITTRTKYGWPND